MLAREDNFHLRGPRHSATILRTSALRAVNGAIAFTLF